MVIRATWKRSVYNNEPAACWYCEAPTNCTLLFKNGEEFWSCLKCAVLHGKIKKTKRVLSWDINDKKLVKKIKKSLVKTLENDGKIGGQE